jgi:hypothetical protein
MQTITATKRLENAIQLLKIDQAIQKQLLREQFQITYESLKPANLLKSSLKEIVTSPDLITNILSNVIGLTTGYFSNKIVVGTSSNVIRRILGSLLQVGVTNTVTNHPDAIKSIGMYFRNMIISFKRKQYEKSIYNKEYNGANM